MDRWTAVESIDGRAIDRRRVLAAGASVTTAVLAGCSEMLDFFGGLVLEDVNVFNTTEHRITGSVVVTGPDETTALDATFDIPPEGETEDEDTATTYGGVLEDAGQYTVSTTLDGGPGVDAPVSVERSVDVTEPGDQHVIVGLGTESGSVGVFVEVIDEFSDLEETTITPEDG
ncbi:Uncharacterized protein HSBGL_1164 [Halapricum desulfuricans]|uniref:Uncharacterized protein n=1 Tax=Halapricum desulfuricans TaxID=2841257 RepID=A0A897NG77_9EURY|nr:hypothetical protein [Halapricum desulfuricans]QSG11588.1 Uncharacterized protein HSBGL_1164 [Halapricum desulfuricans]